MGSRCCSGYAIALIRESVLIFRPPLLFQPPKGFQKPRNIYKHGMKKARFTMQLDIILYRIENSVGAKSDF
jgi:hypothetical protein